MKITSILKNLMGMSEYRAGLDENHLADPSRRRFTAPRSAASQLFAILNSHKRFAKEIVALNNQFTLIRFAVVGQELRMLAYRAATDLHAPTTYSVFDEHWATDGTFHYLASNGTAELLIRNHMPQLRYDPYEPQLAWTMPLTADEVIQFHDSWLPQAA